MPRYLSSGVEPDKFSLTLGQRIRARRIAAGVGQSQLARTLGISRNTLLAYEAGEVRLRVAALIKVADAIGSTVAELLDQDLTAPDPHALGGLLRTAGAKALLAVFMASDWRRRNLMVEVARRLRDFDAAGTSVGRP